MVDTAENYPVWLRDSRRLLFREGPTLYVIDIKTRKRHVVLPSGAPVLRFSISPDNRTIYYTIKSKEADIWLISLK
jgi:Tol biopolymer transport system component